MSKLFRKYLSNIPGKHNVNIIYKTAILVTAHLLWKALMAKYKTYIMGNDIVRMYVCVSVSERFYIVRHIDSTASYLPTCFRLGFFRSWPSLYLPSSFTSVFLVLSFVSESTSMLFWVIFLLTNLHGTAMFKEWLL